MAESDAFPPSNVPAVTGADAAVAAVTAVMDKQRADADKAIADQEIVDPGQKRAAPEVDETSTKKPDLIEGASTSESIPDTLIERAIALDYTEAEARAMGTTALRKTVVRLEKRAAEERAPRQQDREATQEEIEEFSLPPLNESAPIEGDGAYDPKYLEAMSIRDRELLEHRKEIAEMKQREAERIQNEADRSMNVAKREFEKLIAADEELHDELGDGKSFPTNQRHLDNCKELWELMASQVRKGKSMEAAYKVARAGLFHEKLTGETKTRAAKEMAGKLEVHSKQFSKPPKGSKAAEKPFGKERATEELARHMAQRK